MKNIGLIVFLAGVLCSCSIAPQPIEYGEDVCEFCKMTIVDRQHAAELVTSKGKVFKFDAIECMLPFRNRQQVEYAFILVSDYQNPGKLLDAQSSHYLISPAIPSPMGGNLSAFSSHTAAQSVQLEKGGDLYSWEELGMRNEE